jgi:ATP-dependent 26S proteasome regulatory subunit
VVALNGVYFVEEYEDFAGASYSLVISKTKDEAISFLKDYDEANWKRRHSERCILDHDGEQIESFRETKWSDIFLDGGMVEHIRSEIETFFSSKETYKECGLDWRRGIILAGRPGNGKTLLIRAITTAATVPVVFCIPDEGDTFGMLNRLDRTIRTAAPCLVVVEDIDSIGSNEATRSKLLNMFDGLVTSDGVLTIASTNNPDRLDEAFTGRPSRFDSYYVLDVPSFKQRKGILENKLGKRLRRIPKGDLASILKEMSGLSAAFVQEVAVCSLLEEIKTEKPISISTLRASLRKVKRHMGVSEGGLEKAVKGSAGFAARELW